MWIQAELGQRNRPTKQSLELELEAEDTSL